MFRGAYMLGYVLIRHKQADEGTKHVGVAHASKMGEVPKDVVIPQCKVNGHADSPTPL